MIDLLIRKQLVDLILNQRGRWSRRFKWQVVHSRKKFIGIKGRKMAYIDEGEGAPIVFQHGNPTSS